jgi:hypothetical protein
MDEKKLARVLTGIAKSQRQEAKRQADKARMDESERATRQYVVVPRMNVLDKKNP